MPYLASNQDAAQQDGFKTAMMGAAVLFVGAAVGASYLPKMSGFGTTKRGVANKLYGRGATGALGNAVENISVRNAKDIAESGMTQYALGKNWRGKERIYSKNESLLGRMKDNYLNKDVRAFNKTLKQYQKGNFADPMYGKSKMSIYQDLYDRTEAGGIGLTSKDLVEATNNIHGSKQNVAMRKAQGWSNEDDMRLTQALWGDYSGPASGASSHMMNTAYDEAWRANRQLEQFTPEAQAKREARAIAKDRSGDPYDPSNHEARLAERRARAQEMKSKRAERAIAKENTDPLAQPGREGRILRMQEQKERDKEFRRTTYNQKYAPTGYQLREGLDNLSGHYGQGRPASEVSIDEINGKLNSVFAEDPLANKQPGRYLEAQHLKDLANIEEYQKHINNLKRERGIL